MSSPPSVMRPASGCSNPAIIRSVVVLPDPDGPSKVKNSPAPTVRSTLSTATTSPYVFLHPSTATSAATDEALQDVEPLVQFLVADRERNEDADDVSVDPAREQQQSLLARLAGDAARLLAGPLGQLDGDHRTDPAHLRAFGRHRVEASAELRADLFCARALTLERIENRDRRRARERVAAECAAEAAGRNGVHDLGATRHAGEWQPAAEGLAGDEQVGFDAPVLDRPHRAGASAAGLHLVVDVEDPVLVEQLLQALREIGCHRDEAALAL